MAKEVKIDPAPEIERIATSLIGEFHPELVEVCVLYYLTTGPADCAPQKCNPKLRYGYSREVKGVVKAEVAAGPDFILWVNDLEWELIEARGKQRPFIDHVLEHIGREAGKDGVPKFVIKPHGFEDFPEVLQRFGAWSDEAKKVRDILQPELDFGLDSTGMSIAAQRQSSIEGITLSTPAQEPLTLTEAHWERMRQRP